MSGATVSARDRLAALRSLRDCGCIRVRLGAVPRRYQLLQREGLIVARRGLDSFANLTLNDQGRQVAAIALRP